MTLVGLMMAMTVSILIHIIEMSKFIVTYDDDWMDSRAAPGLCRWVVESWTQ